MRPDLLWRAVIPVAAVSALTAGVPRAVGGGLALAALAVAAERLTRLRGLGAADRVLVGVGGGVVALVLTGVLLGSTSVGLTAGAWVLALAALSATGLAVAAVTPARPVSAPPTDGTGPDTRRAVLLAIPWVAAAVVVAAAAVQVSTTSLTASEGVPVQMSIGSVSGTRVEVVVSSSRAVGPLEVRTSTPGSEISYPLLTVPEDGTSTVTVSLPRTGRYLVTLSYPDQTQPLRSLVLDR